MVSNSLIVSIGVFPRLKKVKGMTKQTFMIFNHFWESLRKQKSHKKPRILDWSKFNRINNKDSKRRHIPLRISNQIVLGFLKVLKIIILLLK